MFEGIKNALAKFVLKKQPWFAKLSRLLMVVSSAIVAAHIQYPESQQINEAYAYMMMVMSWLGLEVANYEKKK